MNPYLLFAIAILVALPALVCDLDEATNAILALGCLAFAYGGFEAMVARKGNSYDESD